MVLLKGEGDFKIGQEMPPFNLKGTDEKFHADTELTKPLTLIVITCNHCPYAQAQWGKLIDIANAHEDEMDTIFINSNDAEKYPDDSFENMQKLATEKNLKHPYLYDETQAVAKAFGAKCTPDIYIFKDRKLVYRGRVDENLDSADLGLQHELQDAIVAAAADQKPSVCNPSEGCSIKWK